MPPPRLSRHLRPCHLPVTTKQVRCVYTTGHAKLSTTGYDTTPQTPSAKGSNGKDSILSDPTDSKNGVPTEEKSWWKQTLGHIASFGGHGDQFESVKSKPGRSPTHAEQPERRATNPQETKKETWREEGGLTQPCAGLMTRQQVGETQQEQMISADWRNEGSASSDQVDMAAIRQQIKQLSEQLRALEARVEGGSSKEQSSSTSAAALRTLAVRPDPTQFNMDNQDLSYLPQTPSRMLQKATRSLSFKVLQTLKRARAIYTRSVSLYATAAGVFARLPAHIVAPVAPSILRHFRSIHGIAMLEDDIRINDVFLKFQPTINLLESILRTSSVPAPSLSDPVVADEMAKYSKTMLYDNFISHILDASWKRYRLSTRRLSEVATELDSIRSPMVAPIASRAREQLLTIAAQANEEGDMILIEFLKPNYKKEAAPQKRRRSARGKPPASVSRPMDTLEKDMQNNFVENGDDGQRLMRQIRAQLRPMKSSIDLRTNSKDRGLEPPAAEQLSQVKESMSSNRLSNAEASTAARTTISSKPPPCTEEVSEQSLLEELFPETNSIPQHQPTRETRDQYPRLELPQSTVRSSFYDRPRTLAQQAAESIQKHGEQITVLQLTNCSTGLTEADFRRIIPKGKHLEGWRRDSDFYKVIPGRDPLSLERLPFYYLLFKTTEAALSYQKNASRLHKLSARYQPASILSAIPPPKGFLEDGEDITAAVASYNLLPKNHNLSLNVLMQPYNPALRQLIERGGYQPVATSAEDKKKRICRVLLHIEGYEPSPSDLFAAITSDAYRQGMLHPLRNESQSSIHRLRDMINLKISSKAVSSSRPRAYGTFDHSGSLNANSTSASELTYDDPEVQSIMGGAEEDRSQAQMNQEVMNRVYNRWVLDFEDVDTARRWSLRWHRRAFPDVASGELTWKDFEEARICNAEVLW